MNRSQHAPFLAQVHACTFPMVAALDASGLAGADALTLQLSLPESARPLFSDLLTDLLTLGVIERTGERYFLGAAGFVLAEKPMEATRALFA